MDKEKLEANCLYKTEDGNVILTTGTIRGDMYGLVAQKDMEGKTYFCNDYISSWDIITWKNRSNLYNLDIIEKLKGEGSK